MLQIVDDLTKLFIDKNIDIYRQISTCASIVSDQPKSDDDDIGDVYLIFSTVIEINKSSITYTHVYTCLYMSYWSPLVVLWRSIFVTPTKVEFIIDVRQFIGSFTFEAFKVLNNSRRY